MGGAGNIISTLLFSILIATVSWMLGTIIVMFGLFLSDEVFKKSEIGPARAAELSVLWPVSLPYLLVSFLVRRLRMWVGRTIPSAEVAAPPSGTNAGKPVDPDCSCPRCTAAREKTATAEAADTALPDTDIVVGRVDHDGNIHLVSKGFTMRSFIIRALIFVAGIIGGQIPGLWGAITDTVVRWRTELPSDASPLARKIYSKLEIAEGWELTNGKDDFYLDARNTSLHFLPEGTVDVTVNDSRAASLTGAEARAVRNRGSKIRDSIATMRQESLTGKLFNDKDRPPKTTARQTVAKGE